MMRGATILWAALATIAGTGLFMLKYEVQAQEHRLASLRKDIVDTQESIHVLKAEWSYMNDPVRLREQAERHLGLRPMKPTQIATIDNLPMAGPRLPSENRALVQDDSQAAHAPVASGPVVSGPVVTAQLAADKQNGKQGDKQTAKPVAKPADKPVTKPHLPAKPGKSVVVAKAAPAKPQPKAAPQVTASAKAPPPVVKPSPAKPGIAPTYPVTPASAPMRSAGNVMVITSPAVAGQEMASSRVRP